jgi:hypothetical protein
MAVDPVADLALSEAHKAVVRRQLAQLAEQDERPGLRDLARDVLAGRTDLRGALLGPRYEEALNHAMGQFSGWYQNLTPEERAEQVRLAEEYAAEVREEAVAEQRPRRVRPQPSAEEDWASRPILRKRRGR